MQIIKFPEVTIIYGAQQPFYTPLPAYKDFEDPNGRMVCCWKLSFIERLKVLWYGLIWQQILTFGHPLQAQKLTVEKPEIKIS